MLLQLFSKENDGFAHFFKVFCYFLLTKHSYVDIIIVTIIIISYAKEGCDRMKTLKYSRQRESIKANLMNRTDHPTADALYLSIREEFPNISLGTVYRNLNLLVELGEIIKFSAGDGSEHFDFTTDQHYHLICKTCGTIHDLPVSLVRDTSELLTESVPGRIDSHSLFFYGECEDCLKKKGN